MHWSPVRAKGKLYSPLKLSNQRSHEFTRSIILLTFFFIMITVTEAHTENKDVNKGKNIWLKLKFLAQTTKGPGWLLIRKLFSMHVHLSHFSYYCPKQTVPAGVCEGRSSFWCTRSCFSSADRAGPTPRPSGTPAWRRST